MSNEAQPVDQVYILPVSKKDIVTQGEMIQWYMYKLLHQRTISVGSPSQNDLFNVICAVNASQKDESVLVFNENVAEVKEISIHSKTRPYILSHSYKIAIVLDLSESSSFVHFRYKLVNAELIAVQLHSLLQQLCDPIQTKDGRVLLNQSIQVSIMAHFPMSLLNSSEHVLINCLNLDGQVDLEQIMNVVNKRLHQLAYEICCVKLTSNKLISSLDLKNDQEYKVLNDLSNELCNILSSGIMLLNMMPDSTCQFGADMFGRNDRRLIVLITDGLMSVSNPALLESFRKSLIQRHIGLSVIVAEPPEVLDINESDSLSHLSYENACSSSSFKSATVFSMISSSMGSLGCLVVPREKDPEFDHLKHPLHKILLCGFFSNRYPLLDKSTRMVKNYAELKMPFSVSELMCLKMSGHGFCIQSGKDDESGIQTLANGNVAVKLIRSYVGPYRLCYKIIGSSSVTALENPFPARRRGDIQSVVSIYSESNQTCVPTKRKCLGYKTKKLVDDIVWRMIHVDRMMVSLINSIEECIGDTYRSTVAVFVRSANSKSELDLAHQLRRAHSTAKFCLMWKPILSIHPSYWSWYLRDFKVTLLLEHDSPLPDMTKDNERTSEVKCTLAKHELNTLLQEFFPITFLENQIYLKHVQDTPTNFCLLHVYEPAPASFFVILKFYFNPTTMSNSCASVIEELTGRIPLMKYKQVSLTAPIMSQLNNTPLSKKNKRCSIVDRQLLRLETSNTTSSCYFQRLPRPLIHELLVEYKSFPSDLLGRNKKDMQQHLLTHSNSYDENVQRAALSRFFHRKVWIRSFLNLENAPISNECIDIIIGTLIRQRLSKGFHFGKSNEKGIHVLFAEFALSKRSETVPCLAQYTVFPVRQDEILYFSKLMDESDLSAENEIYFVCECWIEPQDGDKQTSVNRFFSIVNQIRAEDDDIFKLFITLEYALPCRVDYLQSVVKLYEKWNSLIVSKTNAQLMSWLHSEKVNVRKIEKKSRNVSSNNEYIFHLPFEFNFLPLLEQSSQALTLLSCFANDDSNSILLNKLNDMLARSTNQTEEYSCFKTPSQSIAWIQKALRRVEQNSRRNLKITAFIQALNQNEISWNTFFKHVPMHSHSQPGILIILTPTLATLNCWNENIHWESSYGEHSLSGRMLPVVMCFVSKAILTSKMWGSVGQSLSQSPSCTSIIFASSFSSLNVSNCRSDTFVFDFTRSPDDNNNQSTSLSMSSNIGVTHVTGINPQSSVLANIQPSIAYKSPHFRKRDRSRSITIHSAAEEEAMDLLCRQCDDLRELFDNIIVNAIFDCVKSGINVERNDLDFALSMCQESSNDIPLTDIIRLYCSHMRNYPKISSMGLQASLEPCTPFKRNPEAFQKRFMNVINTYFKPIPSCTDIFYFSYDLDDDGSKQSINESQKTDCSSINKSTPFFITFSIRFICRSYDKIIPFDPNSGFPLCLHSIMSEIDDVHPSASLSDVHILLDVISMIMMSPTEDQNLNVSTVEDLAESGEEFYDIECSRDQLGSLTLDRHSTTGVCSNSASCGAGGGAAGCGSGATGTVGYFLPPPTAVTSHHHHYSTAPFHQCQVFTSPMNHSLNTTQGSGSSNSSSKLKRQLNVMAKCMTELRWILTDELTSIMLSFPICKYHIDVVVTHIQSANNITNKQLTCNCRQSTVSLKFVMGVQNSCDAFEQEIQSVEINQKYKLMPISRGLYILILAKKQSIDSDNAKRRHSSSKTECSTDSSAKYRKRFSSDQDRPLSESIFLNSTLSVNMDTVFQDIEPWMSPKSLPDYWLILKIRAQSSLTEVKDAPTHFVDVLMHLRESDLDGSIAEEADGVFNKVLKIVKSVCSKVNKKMILIDLEDTRMCAPFLVPDEEDASMSSIPTESMQDDAYLAANLDISIKPGQFACDLQWTAVFTLHPRLRTMNVKHSKGFMTVENALHSFIIYNRRNMFVYRTINTASIYYMIVKENCLNSVRNHSNSDVSHRDLTVDCTAIHLKQKPRPTSLIDYENNMCTHSITDVPSVVGATNRIDSVAIHVYGLDEPDQSVKDHITSLVSKKLDDDTLGELLEILQRNSKCRLYLDDVQDDKHVFYYSLPHCGHFEYSSEYMHYFRQALSSILIVPNYSEDVYSPNRLVTPTSFSAAPSNVSGVAEATVSNPSSGSLRLSCPSPTSTTAANNIDKRFYFIQTIYRAVGIGDQGISWIEVGICDDNGKLVNLKPPQIPNSDYLKVLMQRGVGCFPKWTEIRQCSLPSHTQENYTDSLQYQQQEQDCTKLFLKIRIWKKGEIDVNDLMNKIEPCLSCAMVLLITEYMVLSDPFPAIMTTNNTNSSTLSRQRDRSSTASPELSGVARRHSNTEFSKHTAPTSSCSGLQTTHQLNTFRYRFASQKVAKLNFLLQWFDFANSKCSSEFEKQSHKIPYDFLVLQAVDQYMRWIRAKLRLDLLLYYRSNPSHDEYTIADDNVHFMRQMISSFSETTTLAYIDLVVVVRDIDLWLSLFGGNVFGTEYSDFDGSDLFHHASFYSMKYEPFSGDQKEQKYCVPRQAFVILHAHNNQLKLYYYNWSSSLSDALCSQLAKICQFHCKRSALLTSILLQQLNLFNLNVYSSCDSLDPHDFLLFLNLAEPYSLSDAKKSGGTSSLNQNNNNHAHYENNGGSDVSRNANNNSTRRALQEAEILMLDNCLMVQRTFPLDIQEQSNEQRDPVNIFGMWAVEVRNSYLQNNRSEDKLRSIYESWLVRQKSPITIKTLNILKQYSRCIHSVSTPLLFYNRVRAPLKSRLSPTSSLRTSSKIRKGRRTSATFGIRSFSAIVSGHNADTISSQHDDDSGSEELDQDDDNVDNGDLSWKENIAKLFFEQYQSYLSILGFSNVVLCEFSPNLLAQKTIRGIGILLVEVVKSSDYLGNFFVVRVYQYDCKPSTIDILLSSAALDDATDRIRDLTHFNSFTYDFHLRLIYDYLHGDQEKVLTNNFPIIAFLHDLLTYYAERPAFARNSVCLDQWYIEVQASPKEVYGYIIEHGNEYDIEVKKNNARYHSPSFILHKAPGDAHYSVCRLAYFPIPTTLQIPPIDCEVSYSSSRASSTKTTGSSPSKSMDENCVKVVAFTIMTRKADIYPLIDLADHQSESSTTAEPVSNNKNEENTIENWQGLDDDDDDDDAGDEGSEAKLNTTADSTKVVMSPDSSMYLLGRRDVTVEQARQAQLALSRSFFQNMVTGASKAFLRDKLWSRLLLSLHTAVSGGAVVSGAAAQKSNNFNKKQDQQKQKALCFTDFEELLSHTVSNNLVDLDNQLEQIVQFSPNMTAKFLSYLSSDKGYPVATFSDQATSYICLFCGIMDPSDGDYGSSRAFMFSGKSGTSRLSVYGGLEITESFILLRVEKSFSPSIDAVIEKRSNNVDAFSRANVNMLSAVASTGSSNSTSVSAPNVKRSIVQIDVVRRSKTVPHTLAVACVNAFVNTACYFIWTNLL